MSHITQLDKKEKVMKITKNLIMFICLLLLVACADGPLSSPSTGDLVKPDHEYEIDTWGENSEIYEFTPKSNPHKTCVMFMLDSGVAMGLQCMDKPGDS